METINTGLNGVPVCASAISSTTVDRESNPILMYRGYSIYDLVGGPFEEAVYLILNGDLPGRSRFEAFDRDFKEHRELDKKIIDHIKTYPPDVNRMDFLLTTISFARMFDEDYKNPLWQSPKAGTEELAQLMKTVGLRIGVKLPTIIAYGHRILNGLDPIPPDKKLSYAANFLHMMGLKPTDEKAKALDASLTLYLDHSINNSTFISRVAESARPDPYGPSIAAGVGLKGVLHGGANEMASEMFEDIKSVDKAESFVLKRLSEGGVIFGFGHRLAIYKTGVESRVRIAEKIAKDLAKKNGHDELVGVYDKLVSLMMSDKIEERKRRAPNLDLPIAILYKMLGISPEWNTPIFQASRHFGWTAHMMEQRLDKGPLYRPIQKSINGDFEHLKKYNPIEKRVFSEVRG